MPVVFHNCSHGVLKPLTVSAPKSVVIGVIGDDGAGKQTLLRLATGTIFPDSGTVEASSPKRLHGPMDHFHYEQADTLALYHPLALNDAAARARAAMDIELFRRRGGTTLVASHDLAFIERIADEVWWLHKGELAAKGDPKETCARYRAHVAQRLSEESRGVQYPLNTAARQGDGRAELIALQTYDREGRQVSCWRSGEPAVVRVDVLFHAEVGDPVVGIMIRTRIGFEVYGTNTELEKLHFGPCAKGENIRVEFRFICHLCPGEYTITAASHDPDGVWHDWVEDGIAISVADSRYTAGVACLRSEVTASKT